MLQTTKSHDTNHVQTTQYWIWYTIHSFSTAADIIVPKWSDADDSDESNALDHDEQADAEEEQQDEGQGNEVLWTPLMWALHFWSNCETKQNIFIPQIQIVRNMKKCWMITRTYQ